MNQNYNSQFILENKGQKFEIKSKSNFKLCKSLKSTSSRTCGGGGNAPLYLNLYKTHEYQSYESTNQKFLTLGRFMPYAVIKALKMLGQSKKNKSARSVNPRLHSIIARFCVAKSWQSIFVIRQIRYCAIDFIYSLKSRGLDTSLHCVSLSMTKICAHAVILNKSNLHLVLLRALARSIHFSDFRITLDSLTLGESKSNFGLLRRICDSPRNDGVGRFVIARFGNAESWQSTFHTTFKEIQMQT